MRNTFLATLALCIALFPLAGNAAEKTENTKKSTAPTAFSALVYSRTKGFRHDSIPEGIALLKKLAEENNFKVEFSENQADFTDAHLKRFDIVVFLNTTGDILDDTGKAALETFIKDKHGFVGIHAATDTEYKWPWYGNLVGARFAGHPETQTAKMNVCDKKHLATRHLPDPWEHRDEWYNFRDIVGSSHVLLKVDETSYKGGTNGDNHPVAWTRTVGDSRIFYTALGHTKECYAEPLFIEHLRGGLFWAAGKTTLPPLTKAAP